MKRLLFLFSICFCLSQLTFGQKQQIDLPINWDDSATVDYTVTDFGGNASMLAADPLNSSNTVLQSVKTGAAQSWAGTTLSTTMGLANKVPFKLGETVIKAIVYSPDSGISVKLKVEDADSATISVETDVLTTKANAWDTLTFDFSNQSPNTAAINFSKTYDKASIFYNFGVDGMTAGAKTYYLDSIWFAPPAAAAKAQIDLPINWEDSATVDYTVTDFGGNASMLAADPLNSANTVLQSDKTGSAQSWAGTTISTPMGLANKVPFKIGETIIKAIVYSPDSGISVKLKVEDADTATISVETDVLTTKANAWDTLTFDFSNQTPNTAAINFSKTYDKASIFYNFGVDGMTAGAKTYYLDSIWFAPPATAAKAQIDLPINWEDSATIDYTVTDFGGNASMLAADPMNSSNTVLKSDKTGSAQTWAGTTLSTNAGLANKVPFKTGETVIKALVYSPDSGIVVKMKTEDAGNPNISVETDVMTMKANAWDTLTFDFTNPSSGTSPINFSNTYDKVSIFYNFGVDGMTAGAKTYYVDSVWFAATGGSGGPTKAQIDLPINWEDSANIDYTTTDFGGNASMLAADPMNSSNTVLMSEKTASAQTWAGTTLSTNAGLANKIPFKTGETVIKALVYSPDSGIVVKMKTEDAGNPNISVETDVVTHMANAWDTLTFDFTNHASGTSPINFSNTYDKVSIFYNFGVDGMTAGAKTYYVDSVWFAPVGGGGGGPTKAQIDLPINWDDSATIDYTVTDFGGNASVLDSDPLNSSNTVLKSEKTGSAQSWAGTTLSTNAGLANKVPFKTGETVLKAVVYSPDAGTPVRLKVEDASDPAISVETEVNTTVANAWDTLTFDFVNHVSGTAPIDFSKTYDKLSIFYNFGTDGATAGAKTYYVDSVYFTGTGGTPPPVPDTSMVTFRIDMSQHMGSYTTPEVNGTFNGWCGNCSAMSDSDNDDIWEITIPLWQDSVEFKYSFDNWTDEEDLDSTMWCVKTTGSFTNRFMMVTHDTILPAVCWNSCDACDSSATSIDEFESNKIQVFPNPANNVVMVAGIQGEVAVELVDMQGRTIMRKDNVEVETAFDLAELNPGIYLIQIHEQVGSIQTHRFIKY